MIERKTGFPTWAKLLIAFGTLGLLGFIGLIVLTVNAVKNSDELFTATKGAMDRGKEYAASHTQAECVDESFREMEKCSGLKCDFNATMFLQECMQDATASPEFCAQTPRPENVFDMTRWSMSECHRRGHGRLQNQSCTMLVQTAARLCHTPPFRPTMRP